MMKGCLCTEFARQSYILTFGFFETDRLNAMTKMTTSAMLLMTISNHRINVGR